jgi:hypothetical protein
MGEAAITVETLRAVAIKGPIERDGAARLTLTKQNKGAPWAARSISIAARVALFSRPLTLPE